MYQTSGEAFLLPGFAHLSILLVFTRFTIFTRHLFFFSYLLLLKTLLLSLPFPQFPSSSQNWYTYFSLKPGAFRSQKRESPRKRSSAATATNTQKCTRYIKHHRRPPSFTLCYCLLIRRFSGCPFFTISKLYLSQRQTSKALTNSQSSLLPPRQV
jgi:hypothetical protein